MPKNPHDCYNQFIIKKNPWWALYCLNRRGMAPQFYAVRASGLHLSSFYTPASSLLTGFVSQVCGSNLTLVFLKLPWGKAFLLLFRKNQPNNNKKTQLKISPTKIFREALVEITVFSGSKDFQRVTVMLFVNVILLWLPLFFWNWK